MRIEEFEIDLTDGKQEKMGIPDSVIQAKISVNLDDVSVFRESFLDESDETLGETTLIYLKNGETFVINTPYLDFVKLMKK